MNIKDMMNEKTFVVVGDTLKRNKFAYIIKKRLISNGYTTYGVGKELSSINDIIGDIDIIDLCINPIDGLRLMKDCNKKFKGIIIQPGASSRELLSFLDSKGYKYVEGCVLRQI